MLEDGTEKFAKPNNMVACPEVQPWAPKEPETDIQLQGMHSLASEA